MIVINLSGSEQITEVKFPDYDPKKKYISLLEGNEVPLEFGKEFHLKLSPYQIEVFQLKSKK